MGKNKYANHSKISEAKFREIVKYFALDLTASQIAILTKLNRNTVNRFLMEMRRKIYAHCLNVSRIECGEIEIDESYFGPRRVRRKRGRGAVNKTIVFGLLKRNGKVYTHIVPNAKVETLLPLIRSHATEEVIVNADGWDSYDGLVDMGYKKHYRVNHGKNEFVRWKQHANGIESFWGFTKHRLVKFNGLKHDFFDLHLKECEFRFNLRGGSDVYHEMLKIFRKNPIFPNLMLMEMWKSLRFYAHSHKITTTSNLQIRYYNINFKNKGFELAKVFYANLVKPLNLWFFGKT